MALNIAYSPPFYIRKAALPAWVLSNPNFGGGPVPLLTWTVVPNSVGTSYFQDGGGINPAYLAQIGMPPPTGRTTPFFLPRNKYNDPGVSYAVATYENVWTVAAIATFSGMAVDTGRYTGRTSAILTGGGDSHWGPNQLWRFSVGADSPYWDVPVIGANVRDIKTNKPGQDPLDLTRFPNDDARPYRFYDGSPRGGHMYWGNHFLEGRDWFVKWGFGPQWPVDSGLNNGSVGIADIASGTWRREETIPPCPFEHHVDQVYWTEKHKYTEDVWSVCTHVMAVWRNRTNKWEAAFTFPNPNADWAPGFGALDEDNDFLLFFATVSGGGSPFSTWYTLSPLSGSSPMTFAQVTMTGALANMGQWLTSMMTNAKYVGMCKCPDRNSFLLYFPAPTNPASGVNVPCQGKVWEIKRTGPTSFDSSVLATSGAASTSRARLGGGVLNNWQYIPQLKGMVIRNLENEPMYYLRTGT